MFVFIGKSITTVNDPLVKMPLTELIARIRNPKPEFVERLKQIRITQSIDGNRYKELKKSLPYFTCGNFHPCVRRKENFASISLFVIDLDHLLANDFDVDELKIRLKTEEQLFAFFLSPSGDGLKLIFQLSTQIKDASLFQAFYKIFAQKLAIKHNLNSCIDLKTSDVTRACFISHDPDAFINEAALHVYIEDFISTNDFEQAEMELKEAEKFAREIIKTRDNSDSQLTDDILAQIKHKLNPSNRKIVHKNIFLPPEIDEFVPLLESKLSGFSIQLIEKTPINYGRKLRFKAGIHWAELNLFYGKKGYSIVKTPKTGSSAELAESCFQILQEILNTNQL